MRRVSRIQPSRRAGITQWNPIGDGTGDCLQFDFDHIQAFGIAFRGFSHR